MPDNVVKTIKDSLALPEDLATNYVLKPLKVSSLCQVMEADCVLQYCRDTQDLVSEFDVGLRRDRWVD